MAGAARRADALQASVIESAVEGHPCVPLGEVTTDHRYGTSVKCTSQPGEVAVLRIPNVRDGRIDTSNLKFAATHDLGDCFVRDGDLLVVRTNGSRDLIGRVGVVRDLPEMAFASYLIRLRPKDDLDSEWAALALSSRKLRDEIEARAATTAGQYNINLLSLRSLMIPVPRLDEQRRLVVWANRQLSGVESLRQEMRQARRRSSVLRRAVLERAFRGELVAQDPSDEPAAELVKRISSERVDVGKRARQSRARA